MPLYGNDFFSAVEGQPDHIALGYMRALWRYWNHYHCKGLPDNNDLLRRICQIEKDDWFEAKGVIFDNDKFFILGEDLMWHQARADEEWQKVEDLYRRKCEQTWAARQARQKGKE
jgi:uncharacterized protein YdaU (DUF1376 family)